MDQHDRERRRDGGERGGDGSLPGVAARDDDEINGDIDHVPHTVDVAGRGRDHEATDAGGGGEPPGGVDQKGNARQRSQGLRRARAESGAEAGGRNQDRDVTARGGMRGHVAVLC
ncbi:hypothetical protein GCM10009681_26920 [Luedemannella helvata]|uniref:Uncharacterized protein n=1 Tax=Luedemannella helvata TaxID=349315 RepID=A0ABP4WGU0_9ACTN